jgi:hypothetical protein
VVSLREEEFVDQLRVKMSESTTDKESSHIPDEELVLLVANLEAKISSTETNFTFSGFTIVHCGAS